jgi:tRNA(Ile)-lysidine synthase
MYEQVRALIEREKILDPKRAVLVGVSGGPDSLAMMDILNRMGFQLVVAHLNHGLRSEAEADARDVQRMAEARGLPIIVEKEDVEGYASMHGLAIEEAARIVRYQFLFRQAAENNAQAVVVGHTADDQVETVVMHLLRGCGLAGLKGMLVRALPNNWSRDIPLVRPILACWREDVLVYCKQHKLQPLLDSSNLDVTYFRNRLRHELIPYLEEYNPAIKQILWRMSQVLTGDHQVLESVIEKVWKICVISQGSGYVILDTNPFKKHPIGVQRGLFRKAINLLRPGLRDVDFNCIERAMAFLLSPTQTGQIDLIAGLCLFIENGQLILADWEADLPLRDWPQVVDEKPAILEIPGKTGLSDDWLIITELVSDLDSARIQAMENDDPFQAWISMDCVQKPFQVRSRQPGDRIQPLGMDGHSVKLSEYMINVKIPRRAREGWPLVTTGEEIVWAPGIALSHPYRLTASTRQAIFIQLSRIGNG